jgi:hypothetical protein
MKRIQMVGLCIVAALAFAAIAGATTASAAAKFGQCVPAKKAVYEDSNCSKVAEKKGKPSGKGKFEFKGAGECYGTKGGVYEDSACTKVHEKKGKPDHKGKFEKVPLEKAAVTGGKGELVSPAGTIECTSSSGTQQITGPTALTAQTIFKGCETKGAKCQNTANEGEIATFLLNGALIEPALHKAAINLTGTGKDGLGGPEEGKYLAEFGCTGVAAIRVYGKLGGNITPVNVMGTTETTEFVKGVEQGLESDFGPPGFGAGTLTKVPSEQIGNVTATSTNKYEVHTS